MLERTNEPTNRELKRRTLRWQKHRIPRNSPLPFWQRLTAWLIMLLSAAIVLVMICQR